METVQEAKLVVGKSGSGNRGHFLCAMLRKTPRKGEDPSTQLHGKPRNHRVSAKAKGGTRAPKLAVYRRHPRAVSGFGEKRAIPYIAQRMSGG